MTEKQNDLKPIRSLGHLRQLAAEDIRYKKLAVSAALNLGWDSAVSSKDVPDNGTFTRAIRYLESQMGDSDVDDEGLIGEVNYCLDIVT